MSDFNVSTSSDTVASSAAAYTIGANGSAGVVVTPNPSTVGSLSTYTISGLKASAAMTGGSSTLNLVGPSGTVFPANSASYSITDSTTSSGSGTVTAGVSGGGTNNVTVTVPNSINSGDSLTLTILTVINPSVASSSYSIALHGNINGPDPDGRLPRGQRHLLERRHQSISPARCTFSPVGGRSGSGTRRSWPRFRRWTKPRPRRQSPAPALPQELLRGRGRS